jgi:Zn-finger protein
MDKQAKKQEVTKVTTVDIQCIDCGATRTIGKGEAFQVKRCVACQEVHRKQLRKEYRKNRLKRLVERVQALETLLIANNIAIPA